MDSSVETRPLFGLVLVVMAMSIVGLIDNFVKNIAAEAGLWQFHFLRSVILCSIVYFLARSFSWRLRPRNLKSVAMRSFFFSSSMVLYFGSLGGLPVAHAGAGLFSSPIFVLIISAVFLQTKVGAWRVLAVAIGFSGVLLVLKPGAEGFSPLVIMPVAGGLFYALSAIATRRWCDAESTATLLMGVFIGLGAWGMIGTVTFTIFPVPAAQAGDFAFFTRGWVTLSGIIWGWIAVQVVGSLAAVALVTRGYQSAEVSFVAVFEYSFLLFAGFWGYVLWGEVPDYLSVLGFGLIVLSGTIIALRSR